MKKLLSVFLLFCLILGTISGCASDETKKNDNASKPKTESKVESTESGSKESPFEINPLTGTATLKKDALKIKPVAIMINNAYDAQNVQASLSDADIIYETYVEGGITRLLAVYKDIRTVGKNNIGSLRSGRYSYVDLALGHGAQFVHAGLDDDYCLPHIRELGTTTFDMNSNYARGKVLGGNAYAKRINNGTNAYEHTLYTTGDDLYKGLKNNVDMKLSEPQENWMNFLSEGSEYKPDGGNATSVYVPFSGQTYSAEFKYDDKAKTYYKYRGGSKQSDYNDSNDKIKVENILILYSDVTYFSDYKHVKTHLESGTGYYISNGGYVKINWSKGGANKSFEITDANGKEIDYNPGKTYVCLTRNENKGSTEIK